MDERYEYEIVRHGKGFFGMKSSAMRDYEEVIRDYAARGWRLVTVLPLATWGPLQFGQTKFIDLIFERKIK
jgi:hypothetical protein